MICIASSLVFMIIVAILIVTLRHVVGLVFSTDEDVVAAVATIAPFAALFQVSGSWGLVIHV